MPLWGNQDAASNSTIFAPTSVKLAPNSANRDNLFDNTTADAFITGVTVGQFGVDGNEVAANPGIAHTGWVLRTEGSGGRAGRVMTEVLVAGGIGSDASDDTPMPDAKLTIATQPANTSANSSNNQTATFSVVASVAPGSATPTYYGTTQQTVVQATQLLLQFLASQTRQQQHFQQLPIQFQTTLW